MAYTIIVHLTNAEPILGEVDEIPTPQDRLIQIKNPHRADGKDVDYIDSEALIVMWPVERVSMIEILSKGQEEEIFGFVRE